MAGGEYIMATALAVALAAPGLAAAQFRVQTTRDRAEVDGNVAIAVV